MNDDLLEWRKQRLQDASRRAGGDAELGRLLGHKSGAQIGHMLLGRRPITEKTVQKIERLRGYRDWFARSSAGEPSDVTPRFESVSDTGDHPIIRQYEGTGGAMGHGFNLSDNPPGLIKSWRVDHEWLRLNVPVHTGLRNLAIVTGFGPSMRPLFNPGDPLLVDTGVKIIDHEGVYFFRVGDEGFIKIIQRVPEFNGPGVILRVISKNPDFPPYDLSPSNPHLEVLGKVLTVWRSEQF